MQSQTRKQPAKQNSGTFGPGGQRPPSASNRQPTAPAQVVKQTDSQNNKGFNFNIQGTAKNPATASQMTALQTTKQSSNRTSNGQTAAQLLDSGVYGSNSNLGTGPQKFDIQKLANSEEDERYRYLLKNGIVRRIEDEDKVIFAELPQIPGVLVVYRKPSERNTNPDRLNLDKRDLVNMPLLEGEERLRLLNLQHNHIGKIENLVSLPNLIFLDLYNNQIKEISHLHTVPTLRVLMLGKNYIERIRNLQNLSKLDVLDLHSNKITKIENINHLSDLRVLNLANNLITNVENLNGLGSLTELNLRRNVIESVNGLSNCPKLQRIFLSNNRIEKFEQVSSIKDPPNLSELALDGNPVANHKNYMEFCISTCPNLKLLDSKKITLDMRDSTPTSSSKQEDNSPLKPSPFKQNMASSEEKVHDLSTEITPDKYSVSPDKSITPSQTATAHDDISPEGLLEVIAQEWSKEMERIKVLGLNGYKRRKESRQECLVQSGHAEIEGDTMLFIYGNALEVLNNSDFQKTVEAITFQYVRFDNIVGHSNLSKLKKFSKLKKLAFQDNNIHSFIQISKLEILQSLTSLSIENNDVAQTTLCRTFIVYRFPNVQEINGSPVSDTDKMKARQQFQFFDKILSTPNIFSPKLTQDRAVEESKTAEERQQAVKTQRLTAKKNQEAAQNFITNLTAQCVTRDQKVDELNMIWEDQFLGMITGAVSELTNTGQHINEKVIRQSAGL